MPRPYSEIRAEISSVMHVHNVPRMHELIEELKHIGTNESIALLECSKGHIACWISSFDEALVHFNESIQRFTEIGNLDEIAWLHKSIGIVHFRRSVFHDALQHYSSALDINQQLGDRINIGSVLGNIATVNAASGKHTEALEYFEQANIINKETSNFASLAQNLKNIGNVHRILAQFDKSQAAYESALQVNKQIGDLSNSADVLRHIAALHDVNGLYPRAIELLQEALVLYERKQNKIGIGRTYENMASVYQHALEFNKAEEYYELAADLQDEITDYMGLAETLTNMVSIMHDRGRTDRAFEKLDVALNIYKTSGDVEGIARVLGSIMRLHVDAGNFEQAADYSLQLSAIPYINHETKCYHTYNRAKLEHKKGNLAEARALYLEAMMLAKQHDLRNYMPNIFLGLRDLALKENNLQEYVAYNDEYVKLSDTIRGQETTRKLAAIEAERRIEIERAEKEKHKALLFNTLPQHIAHRILNGETVNDHFDSACVVFLDLVGFTVMSSELPASEITEILDAVFKICDEACISNNVTRIKTIGDAFLAVSFGEKSSVKRQSAVHQHA